MNVFSKVIASLKIKTKKKALLISDSGEFKVLKKRGKVIKRFFASSKEFTLSHSREISAATRLIMPNLTKLKMGEVIERNGFLIKSERTGKTHSGSNTIMTLSVTHCGKVCFVKIGFHTGENNFVGHVRAKEFFKKHNNQMHGYNVEVVPTHLFYSKTNSKKGDLKGFLVSAFFPSEKVTLVNDIEHLMGEEKFRKSHLGKAVFNISNELYSNQRVQDADSVNCFLDKSKNTLYFFDLYAQKSSLPK